jgi:hypothetical protein
MIAGLPGAAVTGTANLAFDVLSFSTRKQLRVQARPSAR